MIEHILHGLVLLLVIVFGLPVLISLAMGLMGTGRANFKAASHVMITTVHVVVSAFEDLAEQLAKVLVKRYTKQKKILEPIVKHVLLAVFVLAFLAVLSVFN